MENGVYLGFPGADPGFGQGGAQLLRPKVANVAKRSRTSEVSILWPGSRARLRALEAFGFLMLKYAFSHILETLFLLFLTSILMSQRNWMRPSIRLAVFTAVVCKGSIGQRCCSGNGLYSGYGVGLEGPQLERR